MPTATRQGDSHDLDPSPETGGGLRIVRLRLTLALLAAALLPLAVVAPVLRIVGDDGGASEAARLEREAEGLAAALMLELEATHEALLPLVDGAVRTLADPDPARIAGFGDRLTGVRDAAGAIVGARLLGADGATLVQSPAAADSVPPPLSASLLKTVGRASTPFVVGPAGAAAARRADVLPLLVPVRSEEALSGVLLVELSMPRLVDLAAAGHWPADRTIELRDAVSARFEGGAPAGAASASGHVIGRAIDPATGLIGHGAAPIEAPGFEGWTLHVAEPFVAAAFAPAPLAVVIASSLALVALVGWMARQVLKPTAQLEASRHRLRELYENEREASLRDLLTGLGNHRAFQEELSRQFDQSNRYHVPLALLMIDLDEFKQVNDSLGHATGDELLTEVGRILRATIRTADRAFRTGGDEFALVLPHTDGAGAFDLAQRLLRRMLEDRTTGLYRRPISFSAGIAAVPAHAADRTQLLIRADAALYRSKRHGRTLVTVFDSSVDQPSLDEFTRAELSSRVARVAAERALTPAYQPIVSLETGRAIGYEGLVRPNAESGFESAAALFGAAEMTGRAVELDRACLEVVIAGAHSLPGDVYISLNISPRSFEAPEFSAAAFLTILRRYRIAPGRVILELTERDVIRDLDRLRAALDECRHAGVKIAADDVGAGNAGLRLLSQIQFNVMKIDLSLVQASAGKEPVTSVLRSLVELAHRWRALVVAEGVETPEQLRMLRSLGVTAGQGYLLGRPGPLPSADDLDVDGLAAGSLPASETAWWSRTGRAELVTP